MGSVSSWLQANAKPPPEPLVESPQLSRRNSKTASYVHSAIERLIAIIENENPDELSHFLSTEKGFRSEQDTHYSLSIAHYVAGRLYDTAEEAVEWLSCAVGNDNVETSSEGKYLLRPLHCACQWGNIFGVQWLISHGANVNVKDGFGRSPYCYACTSSIDAMKKMRCLEEYGYSLQPTDIVWAAQYKFSSSDEAEEVFHHLVNEKGLSANVVNETESTPLHSACSGGNNFGVRWLVAHSAAINRVNKWGHTPFMLACESSIDRSLKVRYLDEKGADCQAKDQKGRTALFYATNYSSCKDETKDVLQYLVTKKSIEINSVDEEKKTPLLHACDSRLPTYFVIEQLIELGADVFVRDRKKQNSLHLAAKNSRIYKKIIDLLINKGVDVSCVDKNGRTPYQVASNDAVRAVLLKHYKLGLKIRSSVCSVIKRLIKLIEKEKDDDLKCFLSTVKGFRRDQYDEYDVLSVFHYVAGRQFETACEANEWLSYLALQRNLDVDVLSPY